MTDEQKTEMLERLLRSQGPAELSPGFKHGVMDSISRLPAPALLARPSGLGGLLAGLRSLGTGEKLALGVAGLGAALMLLPGMDGLLAAWNFELVDTTFSLNFGDVALSASAMSLLAAGAGLAFLTAIGAFSARQRLLGA